MDENDGLLLNDKAFIKKDKHLALSIYMQRWGENDDPQSIEVNKTFSG